MADLSNDYQISACKKYALDNGYTIVGTYADKETAKIRCREKFKKMMSDCKHGKFDTVLVCNLDRISRNLEEYTHNKSVLANNGVNLISISETNEMTLTELCSEYLKRTYAKHLDNSEDYGKE